MLRFSSENSDLVSLFSLAFVCVQVLFSVGLIVDH